MSGGMAVSSHPLAVDAALDVLHAGGTAVDGAVAAAAVLTVVDPRSTGLGGDVVAMVWEPRASEPVGLAAIGCAPAEMTRRAVRTAGYEVMPDGGGWSVTVPGAPAGWHELLGRYGRMAPGRVVEAAVRHAQEGFRVSPVVAREWALDVAKLRRDDAAAALFLPGGRPPRAGELFANVDLAGTLRRFGREGAEPFYTGDLAGRVAAAVADGGGPMRAKDLESWSGPEWVSALRVHYRGVDVLQMPPPTQGVAVLEALGVYQDLGPAADAAEDDHRLVESVKLAVDDAARHVADPAFVPAPVGTMLDSAYLASQRSRIGAIASPAREPGQASDTVYVAVVDDGGMACSLIQSLFRGFGSGLVVPGTGLVLQNRGSGFRLEDDHPGRLEPGKRPFHTIIPAMLSRDGAFAGCLGVVGGYMQPQGQVQVLRNVLDRGMGAQEAVDAPRLRVYDGTRVLVEEGYDAEVVAGLMARGHRVDVLPSADAGGAQLVVRTREGLVGGSDRRKDGYVGVAER